MRYWLIFASHPSDSLSGHVGSSCQVLRLKLWTRAHQRRNYFASTQPPHRSTIHIATIFSFIGDTWCLIKFLAILKFLINGAQSKLHIVPCAGDIGWRREKVNIPPLEPLKIIQESRFILENWLTIWLAISVTSAEKVLNLPDFNLNVFPQFIQSSFYK